MATLSGNKIKNTYQSLVKFSDNGNITTSAKQLTDGFGNNSPMFVSTTQVGIGVTPESGIELHVYGDAKIGSNLTVIGNLVVEGSTTTVGTDTLTVKDPLIVLANNNTASDAVDIGFYGKYHPSSTTLYSGLFREALTGKYRLFKSLEVEPTTTVNTSGTGYAVATLIANLEGNVTGNLTGNVTGDLTGNVTATSVLANGVTATTQSDGDNSTKVATTAYVDTAITGHDTLAEILSGGNTTGGTDIAVSAGDDITFTDTSKSIYGTGGELEIHHNGSNSYITEDGTGALYLQGTYMYLTKSDGSQNYIELDLDGATDSRVKLNYGGATKLQTTNTGVDVTGNIIVSGTVDGRDVATDGTKLDGIEAGADVTDATNVLAAGAVMTTGNQSIAGEKTFSDNFTVASNAVFNGTINLDDDEALNFGTSNAFNLKWSTTAASGQGATIIDSNRIFIQTNFFQLNSRTGESMITATSNGDVELYYNDSKKLETTNTGITVTGTVLATSFSGNVTGGTISGTTGTFTDDLIIDTDTLFVDASTDSVGIGLTNPGDYLYDELVINVPDDSGISLVSGTDDIAYISFVNGTAVANRRGFISYNHDTDTLTTFAQSKVTIDILEATVAYFTDTACHIDKNTTIAGTVTTDKVFIAKGQNVSNIANSIIVSQESANLSQIRCYGSDVEHIGNLEFILDDGGNGGSNITPLTLNSDGSSTFAGNVTLSQPTNGAEAKLILTSKSAAGNSRTGIVEYDADTEKIFFINESTTVAAMTSGGNLGIGTDNPARNLTIYESSGNAVLQLANSTSGVGASDGFLVFTNGVNVGLENKENGYLSLATNATERMRISASGNVGIGTTSPNVTAEIKASGNGNPVTSGSTQTNGALRVRGAATNVLDIGQQSASPYGMWMQVCEATSLGVSYPLLLNPNGGNVGIGQTPSTAKLEVAGEARVYSGTNFGYWGVDSGNSYVYLGTNSTGYGLSFQTGGTEKLRIDSSGNVKVGRSAGYGNSRIQSFIDSTANFATPAYLAADSTNMAQGVGGEISFIGKYATGVDDYAFYGGIKGFKENATSGNTACALGFYTRPTGTLPSERMRINSSGFIYVNTGGVEPSASQVGVRITGTQGQSFWNSANSGTAGYNHFNFYNGNGAVGSIVTSGQATSYNTLSDYRLKENVVEMTGALDRVSQLKPSRFNFIADADKTVDGFLAHEVQEIVPEAISGEKDGMQDEEYEVSPAVYEDVIHPAEEAVYETIEHPAIEEELDKEGNVIVEAVEAYTEEVIVTEAKEEWTEKVLVTEKVMGTREVPDYQGIDQSKLVPLLVGAIQELKAEIESLKLQINN